ncbi:MAG: DUF4440 domain-containing protein [Anaerolineales bacterium]|jgi:hypothetical protein
MLTDKDLEELRLLEESLWVAETRFNRAYMERVLAPDFFEFSRSGRTYTREKMMDFPPVEEQVINAQLPLKDFKVHPIRPDVVLVTYISEVMYVKLLIGNRSSLWVRTPDGWQLKFHQGTPVEG